MLAYVLKRLVQGIITIWFIATATFIAMHAVPGDPLGGRADVLDIDGEGGGAAGHAWRCHPA